MYLEKNNRRVEGSKRKKGAVPITEVIKWISYIGLVIAAGLVLKKIVWGNIL